jgi:hypothetical protein
MLLNKTNLETELLFERKKFLVGNDILNDVRQLLDENESQRQIIGQTLAEKSSTNSNNFIFDLLETDKIFHLEQIKKVSIDYRLRFLDSHLFKNEIPEEAISAIHALEKNHGTKLEGFKIMAPSKTFQLLSYDDPLLFAPIGNNYYYLIHKWGNDLSATRKLAVMPYKSLTHFLIATMLVSVLIAMLIPVNRLSQSIPMAGFIEFLFVWKGVIAVALYGFFMAGKNFNTRIWNRKYFNN